MAFLTLNGVTIPVAKGGQVSPIMIGNQERTFDGSLVIDRRATKREWEFETAALKQSDAEAIRGLLQSLGDVFPFNASLYSSKGMAPYAAAVGYTFHASTAADGNPVYLATKHGTGSIAVEMATTNLLGADARDAENAPTGYTAIAGAVLASGGAKYWQGTKSLKVTPGGGGKGAYAGCNPGVGSPTKTYAGSVYISGTAGHVIDVTLFDATAGVAGTTVTLTIGATGTWYRVVCSITIGAGVCVELDLDVQAHDGACGVFYCDGWQIELATSLGSGCATSWVDGSRVEGHLDYPIDPIKGTAGCMASFWMRAFAATSAIARELCIVEVSATQWWETFIVTGTTTLRTAYTGAHTVDVAGCCDGAWHHIVSSLNPNPGAGEHLLQIWKDGVSSGYIDHAAESFDTSALASFHVGGFSSTGLRAAGVLLDDLKVFPFPASTALVAALYAGTPTTFTFPSLVASGDAIQESGGVIVRAEVDSDDYAQLMDVATWRNNMRRIRFTLREV